MTKTRIAWLSFAFTSSTLPTTHAAELPGVVPAVQSWQPASGNLDLHEAKVQPGKDREDATLAKQVSDELGRLGKNTTSGTVI